MNHTLLTYNEMRLIAKRVREGHYRNKAIKRARRVILHTDSVTGANIIVNLNKDKDNG